MLTSSGFSAAARTSTTTSPSPGTGSRRSASSGGRPSSLMTAALMCGGAAVGEPVVPPGWLDLLALPPRGEDPADLPLVCTCRVVGRSLPLSDLGEHLRDQELVEDLVHRRVREPGIAHVVRVPLVDRLEDLVLPLRRVRVALQPARKVPDGGGERREVVEAAVLEGAGVLDFEVDKELARRPLVLRELPDHVATHHVLEPLAARRPGRDRRQRRLARQLGVLSFRGASDRDR